MQHYNDFYLQATTLPLLQGISAEHILQMQERGALRVVSMEQEEGDIIVKGQHCSTLTMLMVGSLVCISEGDGWRMEESLHAPAVIEEEALWSLTRTYTHTYRPAGDGKLLVMGQQHVIHAVAHNEVFRINLLTRLSNRLERLQHARFNTQRPATVEDKIQAFFRLASCTGNTPMRLSIKMTTLANIIDETRLNVSRALHRLQEDGAVLIGRETITINRI